MKKLLLSAILVMTTLLTACGTYVEPNYAGVLMENYGKNGKSDFSIQRGKVMDWLPGNRLYQVPLWEQRGRFEQKLTLMSADNTQFFSTPYYSFKVIPNRAVDVVFENKQLEGGSVFVTSLEDNVLEPKIYDIMNEESRKHTSAEFMQDGGSLRYEEAVQKAVKAEFESRGLELITFSSKLTFTNAVATKIDNRNETSTNVSVIEQKIIEQQKRNDLEKLIKEGNIIKSQGLTKELLLQQFIEKWDGKTPIYGDTPVSLLLNNK